MSNASVLNSRQKFVAAYLVLPNNGVPRALEIVELNIGWRPESLHEVVTLPDHVTDFSQIKFVSAEASYDLLVQPDFPGAFVEPVRLFLVVIGRNKKLSLVSVCESDGEIPQERDDVLLGVLPAPVGSYCISAEVGDGIVLLGYVWPNCEARDWQAHADKLRREAEAKRQEQEREAAAQKEHERQQAAQLRREQREAERQRARAEENVTWFASEDAEVIRELQRHYPGRLTVYKTNIDRKPGYKIEDPNNLGPEIAAFVATRRKQLAERRIDADAYFANEEVSRQAAARAAQENS